MYESAACTHRHRQCIHRCTAFDLRTRRTCTCSIYSGRKLMDSGRKTEKPIPALLHVIVNPRPSRTRRMCDQNCSVSSSSSRGMAVWYTTINKQEQCPSTSRNNNNIRGTAEEVLSVVVVDSRRIGGSHWEPPIQNKIKRDKETKRQ